MTFKTLIVFVALALLWQSPSFAQTNDEWEFSLLPSNGVISGKPGEQIGWGYLLKNRSSEFWLGVDNINITAEIKHAILTNLMGLPVLAPGETTLIPYTGQLSPEGQVLGFGQLGWLPDAPVGYTVSGQFTIEASWYTASPYEDGEPVGGQLSKMPDFSVSVIGGAAAAPEPSSSLLLAIGGGALGLSYVFVRLLRRLIYSSSAVH